MTEDTISFLPSLDALEHKGVWLFPKMDSKMNENGVFTIDTKEYKLGQHSKYQVELSIAAQEKKCYYEFGYTSGPDNYYGRYSPLCDTSEQCVRNNTIENLKMFVCMSFETRTENDRNLSSKGRSELRKLMKKLVEQITED